MKKIIIVSITGIMIFSLMIMTGFYIAMSNYKYMEKSKSLLVEYNKILEVLIEESKDVPIDSLKRFYDDKNIRITYMNQEGKVIFDSFMDIDTLNNHKDRQEVEEAINNGQGISVRHSEESNQDMLYCATKLKDGSIIRTAMSIEQVIMLKNVNVKYYLLAIGASLALSLILSFRISNIIIGPVKELEEATKRIAGGDIYKRVYINSNDELGRLGKTFNDMAEQLQDTMYELIDKQNRLEAILKSMDSGVVAVDKDLNIIMINPYAKKIFKIKEDIIGKNLENHIKDKKVIDALKSHTDFREIKIKTPKEMDLRIRTAEIITDSEHIGTVAVLQDITDIRKLENMRSQFVANISHEIKTPITSIKGFAETLKYVDDDETRNKFLNIIDEESDRLSRLISDILTLHNIEQNTQVIEENFYTNEVVDSVYLLMLNQSKKKNINLTVKNNVKCEMIGDKDKFKQMIINLVDNAIKYSGENSIVSISTYENGDFLNIEIEDNGAGISKEHLPRIFERFYRVDKARSRDSGGTGLGLAIVKHIVKALNGSIIVESELGKGTKFIVEIPKG